MFKSKEVSAHWLITLAGKHLTSVFWQELQGAWGDSVALVLFPVVLDAGLAVS